MSGQSGMEERLKSLEEENLRLVRENHRLRQRELANAVEVEYGTYLFYYLDESGQDFSVLENKLWNDFFEDIEDEYARCSDLAFAVFRLRHLNDFGRVTKTTTPQRVRQMQELVAECAADAAAEEIETWLLCGVRLRVCKDMRQMIAKLLWDSRMQNCDFEAHF
jgi:hypothetical protein